MKILFGADLVPTEISEPLFIAGDTEKLFGDFLPIIKEADRFVVNLECALTESTNAITKCGPNLKAAPSCAETLVKLGVTDVMLSNNHTFDFGIEGLRDTMANLDRVGLPYTGVGENDTDSRKIYYFTVEDKRFAIVNVCEHEYSYALPDRMGTNPYDPYLTMHDIREAKKNSDITVVIYHGGKEHCRYPSPRLYRLCHEMVECGADVVLTQHSHCIGAYEQYEGGHILYGQGNMHFVKKVLPTWETSLLVEMEVNGDDIKLNFYPMKQNVEEGSMYLPTGEEGAEIMNAFAERNEEMKNGKWQEGWATFCENNPYYKTALNNAFMPEATERQQQSFPHYLDCEAHHDVLVYLYKTWHHTNERN
ncbi:MAG: CapA family protein [Clostridia bacterium]|nr:CapA family protein [Clostridia bacterium]